MEEKIGILIPMYNSEKYIDKCLKSVKEQSYKNLEVIIINDGSTDNSLEICKNIIRDDDRFKIYTRENKGVAFSRNEAIKKCSAKYFIFLDSDDFLDKDYIEVNYNILKEYNVDMVSSNIFQCKNEKDVLKKGKEPLKNYVVDRKEGLKKLLYQYEIQNGPHCKLYKKELFDGVEFPNGQIYEDLATMYKVVNNCNKIAITSYQGYNYVYNPTGITKSKFREKELILLHWAEEIYDFINKNYKEELLLAGKNLLVTQSLFLACKIPLTKKYKTYIVKIKKYIKQYRKELLKDKDTYPRIKLFLIASFGGLRLVKITNNLNEFIRK